MPLNGSMWVEPTIEFTHVVSYVECSMFRLECRRTDETRLTTNRLSYDDRLDFNSSSRFEITDENEKSKMYCFEGSFFSFSTDRRCLQSLESINLPFLLLVVLLLFAQAVVDFLLIP